MLRVLILLHDANANGKTTVIEELQIINDGSRWQIGGNPEKGSYDVMRFNSLHPVEPITARIVDFDRSNGAAALAQIALEKTSGP